jgi:hypothetical protein
MNNGDGGRTTFAQYDQTTGAKAGRGVLTTAKRQFLRENDAGSTPVAV